MKIVAFSDSHRRSDRVHDLFERTQHYADMYVFCGDGLDDVENMFYLYPNKEIVQVAGNCDFGSFEQFSRIVTTPHHKIFVTHGHYQDVKYSLDRLYQTAKDNGCDIALFGHTHEKHCEYRDRIYLINPGSLGKPHYGETAGYCVIDLSDKGVLVSHMEL